MTTDEPLDLTIRRMNQVMDEVEKLLGEVGPYVGAAFRRPTGFSRGQAC